MPEHRSASRSQELRPTATRNALRRGTVALSVLALAVGAFVAGRAAERYLPLVRGPEAVHAPEFVAPESSLPLAPADRLYALARIWQEARASFVFWELRDAAGWDRAFHEALPRVLTASDDLAVYRELQRFVATLQEGHAWVALPPELDATLDRPPVTLAYVEDRFVVAGVAPRAAAAGVAVGAELVAIDGRPVDDVASEIAATVASSTVQARTRFVAARLLEGPRGSETVADLWMPGAPAEASPASVVLTRDGFARGGWERVDRPFVERRDDGVAIVRLSTFDDPTLPERFDEAFPDFRGVSGLVLDLRGNGGGNDAHGKRIVGRLIATPIRDVSWSTRVRNAYLAAQGRGEAWFEGPPWFVPPRVPFGGFRGPVAVLIDAGTCSAAENVAVVLRSAGRATLVGKASCGSTGQPVRFPLPGGGHAAIVTKHDRAPDGRPWVGHGLEPDVPAGPTVEDLIHGRDPALDAAIRAAGGRAPDRDPR